ncbi:hypothetical protein [Cupriavidus campinensis]
MIDMDDLKTMRAWQQRNPKALYLCGGAFAFAGLIANIIQIWRGLK